MSSSIDLYPSVQDHHRPITRRSENAILSYRGWDAFERAHGGPSIIDFDLSSIEGSASFSSRRDILRALLELYDQLDDEAEEAEFLRARVQGSICYLRVLMGQQMAFPDYAKHTLGIDPLPFSDEEVENAKRAAAEALAPFELAMRVEDRERFESKLLIRDPDVIKRGIVGSQELWLQRLRATGIPVPKQVALTVQFTEVDAYWSNWISGSARTGFTLRINLHARKRYDRGGAFLLCLHEICGHAVQMSIWQRLIAEGKLDQACGLTTVHSPEMFAAEGLGQTVPDLLSDDWTFDAEVHLSRALQYYSLIILHNAHLMIYEGISIETILDYVCDHLPFSEPKSLEVEIRDRGVNPLFRTYQLSYALGERAIRKLTQGLSVGQKRSFFFELYTKPLIPSQLLQVGQSIKL